MARVVRRTLALTFTLTTIAALLLVGGPVGAQDQPYPPPPPTPSPQPEARVTCEVTATPDEVVVVCTAEGFAAGSSVLFEARYRREAGSAAAPVAAPATLAAPLAQGVENETYTETVTADADGDARVEFSLPCDTVGRVQVRFSGEDPEGRPHVANGNFDPPDCAPGSLAFTGADLLRLLAIALLVVALGAHLVDKVRRRHEVYAA